MFWTNIFFPEETEGYFYNNPVNKVTFNCAAGKDEKVDEISVNEKFIKKPIKLNEIAELEYIQLESKKDFIFSGPAVYLDEKIIICTDRKTKTILIFNNDRKAVKRINRYGRGPGEYSSLYSVLYDSISEEIFVNDLIQKKVLVYDIEGKFKRALPYLPNFSYTTLVSFNNKELIAYDNNADNRNSFVSISKTNGKLVTLFPINFSKKIILDSTRGKVKTTIDYNLTTITEDGILLTDFSTDTIYRVKYNGEFAPLFVRTPSISKMNPEIFLFPFLETSKYIFFKSITRVCTSEICQYKDFKLIAFDKASNDFFIPKIEWDNGNFPLFPTPVSVGVSVSVMEAFYLIKRYKSGSLNAKEKAIASKISENDNPVLLVFKFKK